MSKTKSDGHLQRALVLSGGGSRAAYQVGVLKGIASIIDDSRQNPFGIVSGTSAGAINAVGLASHADNFRNAVYNIEHVWKSFSPHHVYRSDPAGVFGNSLRWLLSLVFGASQQGVSLLNNEPLAELLSHFIRFDNLQKIIDQGHLRAISVTASGYNTGHSVAFFQGSPDISSWKRFQRIGMRTKLRLEHLLASAAIPIVFPAVRIDREYFGDGAVRQLAPLSPALHLGARKILVVGVGGNRTSHSPGRPSAFNKDSFPSLAQISGHMLNSVFLDSLDYDIERLQHINQVLKMLPEQALKKAPPSLRPIECLVISPSQDLDQVAAKYLHVLPISVRVLLHGIGATRSSGSSILSYLLFEKHFCQELIALGYHDACQKADEIRAFMAS